MASEVAGVTMYVPTVNPAFFFLELLLEFSTSSPKNESLLSFCLMYDFTSIELQKFIESYRNIYLELTFQHVEISNRERNIR